MQHKISLTVHVFFATAHVILMSSKFNTLIPALTDLLWHGDEDENDTLEQSCGFVFGSGSKLDPYLFSNLVDPDPDR